MKPPRTAKTLKPPQRQPKNNEKGRTKVRPFSVSPAGCKELSTAMWKNKKNIDSRIEK